MKEEDNKTVIYTPTKYSVSLAPLLKNTLNEMELNVIKVGKEGMFVYKNNVYLTVTDNVRVGEILRIGNIPTKYKVIGKGWYTDSGGRCFKIRRLDLSLIQGFDIENAKKGTRIIIVNRQPNTGHLKKIFRKNY